MIDIDAYPFLAFLALICQREYTERSLFPLDCAAC